MWCFCYFQGIRQVLKCLNNGVCEHLEGNCFQTSFFVTESVLCLRNEAFNAHTSSEQKTINMEKYVWHKKNPQT